MSYTYSAAAATISKPSATSLSAATPTLNRGEITIADAGDLSVNDTIALCKLPANHIPIDLILSSEDLDTNATPTIAFNAGIGDESGTVSDADLFFNGATVSQAGGIIRPSLATLSFVTASTSVQVVVLTITAAAATGATDKKIKACLLSHPI